MIVAAIRTEGLYKVFGRRADEAVRRLQEGASREDVIPLGATPAVIDVTFDVKPGEIFVVMGLSGSGKSTLIRTLNGLLIPTAGHVYVGGDDIAALNPAALRTLRRDQMSMVFQHFALLPHRTVLENAAYPLKVRGLKKDERAAKARDALAMVGLDGWEDKLPQQLSGGMRQRVGLARALAAETDIMLMDEAFSALDPLIRREMQDQLLELQQRLAKTIVFITHDLNEAMRLGDRIAMMRAGRIVQIDTAEAILRKPANDYVAQFVQDVDRTRVLTAATVMEPVGDGALERGQPTVSPGTMLADVFSLSAQSPLPVAVVDDDRRLVGVIRRETLLSSMAAGDVAPTELTAEGEVTHG
ncbi:quaternary amine ABC transporter ATP-binding protein [Qaidamihabitans albus]|uniref:quaternary amine ABC transporter ATP-binding protein n=1 Tax=Qaidamihabitans albus TaxID=2795733 RepID=UPI0027DD2BA4|nr:betaine/proline/choline family ABC transporter ATP-binding protein [Qaidamihabitans albus]